MSLRAQLLRLAVPLVKTHGFTREALALSALHLPKPHQEPLPDHALNALFGNGDDARRALIHAWLDAARENMGLSPSSSLLENLRNRLKENEPVLRYLPEAFALVATPESPLPPVNPLVAVRHAWSIADEACSLAHPSDVGPAWYRRRTAAALAYGAAELTQISSPTSSDIAYTVLDKELNRSLAAISYVEEVGLFGQYVGRSWLGIGKSLGL